MDKRSEEITEVIDANGISAQKSSFPYDGIFSPHGFLSTISSSNITDADAGDDSSGKVDDQCEDQGQGQLNPHKKLKIHTTFEKVSTVIPKNDLPPTELAFSIDHILEKVILSLEAADLLNCRLVCHRWCIIATPELQKKVELSFLDDHLRTGRNCLKLPQLTQLLKKKSEIARSRFPCQKFAFDITHNVREHGIFCSTQLTNFLDIYGIHIRSLSLCIEWYSVSVDENFVLAELREFLTEKTPNLKHFSVTLQLTTSTGNDAKLISDSESEKQEACKNKSLKTFYIHTPHQDSSKVVDGVLQLAPNLEELIHEDGYIRHHPTLGGSCSYSYFAENLNRLYLLKTILMSPSYFNARQLNNLEKILMACLDTPGTLKLKRITIYSIYFGGKEEHNFMLRFGSVLSRLLNCSCDSLETIKWKNVIFQKGIEWRKVMSSVKLLKLDNSSDITSYFVGRHDADIFPPGLGLSTIFPNLRSVKFLYDRDEPGFIKFLNRLNPEEEVVNSVKLVRVRDTNDDDAVSTEALELLRKFFPKAEIQYPFPLHPVDSVCNRYGNCYPISRGSTPRHK